MSQLRYPGDGTNHSKAYDLGMLIQDRERLLRLERKVDYLFQQLGISPDAALGTAADPTAGVTTAPASGPELPSSFYDALRRGGGGNIVEAVKIYRDSTGVGLADAKKAVEAIARANG
jgi:ribosomal protein L7/L12